MDVWLKAESVSDSCFQVAALISEKDIEESSQAIKKISVSPNTNSGVLIDRVDHNPLKEGPLKEHSAMPTSKGNESNPLPSNTSSHCQAVTI